ncbi:MAG: hypothetical protein DRQ51_10105 [Gammaproteobacteria bacterium]|nr:MAG: hypothetical protein DRQ51_10105 [Gammaproteobacteria bacterium]
MSYYQKQFIRNEFSDRLNVAVKNQVDVGTTKQKISQRIGVTRQALNGWLVGVSMPNQARMPIVAEKLGVSLAWLRDGTGDMLANKVFVDNNNADDDKSNGSGQKNDKFFINDSELSMIKSYRKLNSRERDIMLKMLFWLES